MRRIIFGENKVCIFYYIFVVHFLLCEFAECGRAPEVETLKTASEEKQRTIVLAIANPELCNSTKKGNPQVGNQILNINESSFLVSTPFSITKGKKCCIEKFLETPRGSVIGAVFDKIDKGKIGARQLSGGVKVKHQSQASKLVVAKLNVVVKRGVPFDLGSGLHKTYAR